ncbi:2-phospho-L-lactate guanylyltransferase [Amycolatopsis rifamycinica]|uniref:Phosphoenolpyruvate guanylyltransferase n=1 Tax=Amycolatopsis rifamycinica TaxID=287986 RepID=A0A066U1N4_9PSEU|nr:2-phospho-L-lactate guanylyltransferase [Amycolatopsis rifamycinica]KDN21361.1 2-phospho-L-lactate guanylyltransferase [Amycolatopsis rifamycinica]
MDVDLVVPMKHPRDGKSRLRGAVDPARHPGLVLALAADTLAAVVASAQVRRVLLVAADPAAVAELGELGVEIVAEPAEKTLNAAFRHGAALLKADDPGAVVGALQADLPALRAVDLTAALAEAAGRRAFVADRQGTGTTLLLAAAGGALDPRFGPGSARLHAASGAVPLSRPLPTLRGDVDTPDDLAHVRALGVGKHTAAHLGEPAAIPR